MSGIVEFKLLVSHLDTWYKKLSLEQILFYQSYVSKYEKARQKVPWHPPIIHDTVEQQKQSLIVEVTLGQAGEVQPLMWTP